MSIDDISSLALSLSDFLSDKLGYDIDDEEYDALSNFLEAELNYFITKEPNYN